MKVETRYFEDKVELRAEKGQDYLEGYALKYNTKSRDFGGFYEVIKPGALDNTNMRDVLARLEHKHILGRTLNGTLTLELREDGLFYRVALPNTTHGRDAGELAKRGDIFQSSFAFGGWKTDVIKDKNGDFIRNITQIETLIDVAPVSYPAYPDTTTAKRDVDNFKKELNEPLKDKKQPQTPKKEQKRKEKAPENKEKPHILGLSLTQRVKLAKLK